MWQCGRTSHFGRCGMRSHLRRRGARRRRHRGTDDFGRGRAHDRCCNGWPADGDGRPGRDVRRRPGFRLVCRRRVLGDVSINGFGVDNGRERSDFSVGAVWQVGFRSLGRGIGAVDRLCNGRLGRGYGGTDAQWVIAERGTADSRTDAGRRDWRERREWRGWKGWLGRHSRAGTDQRGPCVGRRSVDDALFPGDRRIRRSRGWAKADDRLGRSTGAVHRR